MSFLKQWRPGGVKGTPQQLLQIKSLRAELESRQLANAVELQELRERVKDKQEQAVIARGIAAHRAEKLAAIAKNEADKARLLADCDVRLKAAQNLARQAAVEMCETIGIYKRNF